MHVLKERGAFVDVNFVDRTLLVPKEWSTHDFEEVLVQTNIHHIPHDPGQGPKTYTMLWQFKGQRYDC